jgi:hypothetical protein
MCVSCLLLESCFKNIGVFAIAIAIGIATGFFGGRMDGMDGMDIMDRR